MKLLQNLSIRLKVMSIAIVGLFGFSLYLAFTYVATSDVKQQMEKIRQSDLREMQVLETNSADFNHLVQLYEQAITHADERSLEEARVLDQKMIRDLEGLRMSAASRTYHDPRLLQAFDDYRKLADSIADAAVARRSGGDELASWLSRLNAAEVNYVRQQKTSRDVLYQSLEDKLDIIQERGRVVWLVGVTLGSVLGIMLLLVSNIIIRKLIIEPLKFAAATADKIAAGDLDVEVRSGSRDELGSMLRSLRRMRDSLASRFDADRRTERVKSTVADLTTRMRGDMGLDELGQVIVNHLVPALHGQVGVFYLWQDDHLKMLSSHAFVHRKSVSNTIALGEGLVGQAALERKQIVLSRVPEDYLVISSGLGESRPNQIVVTPVVHESELRGVLEIATVGTLSEDDLEILQLSVESIAIALSSAVSRLRLNDALRQTREQAEKMRLQQEQMQEINEDLEAQAIQLSASELKLQQQQEDLKVANAELEEQAQALRASEESLQAQQEELRVINEELEEQAKLLADQKNELQQNNEKLERARELMEEKNRQLELSSKYKSEFLSTMSHELRTPLNSILILSNSLAENKQGNLLPKQVEHAQVINSAGSDLLALINDILDIAKVEEGKMQLVVEPINIKEMAAHFMRTFEHVAQHKGLYFRVELGEDLPEEFYSDRQRLEQVLRNFFSNALKFTHHGGVTLDISRAAAGTEFRRIGMGPESVIAFSCIDTGIGVAKEKQEIIFEAFQQADGTTSRKYGGTGLGLTISRELGHLLGGEVHISSEGEGRGSTFTLFLPIGSEQTAADNSQDMAAPAVEPVSKPLAVPTDISEFREKTLLIVDDDESFASVVADLAREYRFKPLLAHEGDTGLQMAREFLPDAIILDLGLPGLDGMQVMEQLKSQPATSNIPVHFISGRDEKEQAMKLGAMDYLVKPVNLQQIQDTFVRLQQETENPIRRLLVIEDSSLQREAIIELFGEHQVDVTICSTGADALSMLSNESFDCMILDLSLPDMDGFALLESLHDRPGYTQIPVIVYTGRDLSREEEARLRKYADRIILKTERSAERLLSEVSLFLHWIDSQGGRSSTPASSDDLAAHRNDIFMGKRVLLVDDDMRNIYALSASLEEWGCDITVANNGRESVELMVSDGGFDIVLMDIMMPEMDGYEAMRRIRQNPDWQKLPILALTAKAMRDDRAKCIEAGANDYISKPIDIEKLQSLMRVWLHQ